MAPLKVYSDKNNTLLWKILITAKYAGVEIQVPDFNSETGIDAEFLKKSPAGKIPVLETPEGTIFESNAIARYIAHSTKNHLYGSNAFEAGQIEQWIDFASHEIELPASVWVLPIQGKIPENSTATQRAKSDVRKSLDILNKHLQSRTYLVGNRITLADIVVATSVFRLYELVLDASFRKSFVNTNRWYLTVVNQPNVASVVGSVTLCDKMQVAKPSAAPAPKEEKKKEEKKPKEEKPKEEKPKKKKDEEEDDGEDEEIREKKAPNPLDLLPPSSFNLDDWKRKYSNADDTRGDACPYFWKNFDKAGWSVWAGKYKYPKELEQVFKTCNLVGGFFQRLDAVRKYGFGSIIIFGEENNMQISACFLLRGTEIPQVFKEVEDSELYDWSRVDTDDEKQRKIVDNFWCWDGDFDVYSGGLPFNQGKIFK